jgi:hypothetical protein
MIFLLYYFEHMDQQSTIESNIGVESLVGKRSAYTVEMVK